MLTSFFLSCNVLFITVIVFLFLAIENRSLALLLSLFVGLSFTSLAFFWSLALKMPQLYAQSLLTIVCACVILKFKRALNKRRLFFMAYNKYNLLFILILLIAGFRFLNLTQNWGGWDAFSIWNLHAKFLFYPDYWTRVFSKNLDYSHPDYPLLLPSLIAMGWNIIGQISPSIPAFLSFCVFTGILGVGFSAISNRMFALLFCIILLFDANFMALASSQYADTLVGFLYLVAIILFRYCSLNQKSKQFFVLSGLFASSTVWCKNEGWVFFLIFAFFFTVRHFRDRRAWVLFFMGALPFLISTLFFKLCFAPANDLTRTDGSGKFAKVFELSTYVTIFQYFKNVLWVNYPVVLLLGLTVLLCNSKLTFVREWLILLSTLFVYLAVYLFTPYDLRWHLSTSLDRLVHQLYPAAVWLCIFQLEQRNFFQKNLYMPNRLAEHSASK